MAEDATPVVNDTPVEPTESTPVESTPTEPEIASTEPSHPVEETKTSEAVPYERFKEVNDKVKQYEDYLRGLQTQAQASQANQQVVPDEQGMVDPNQIVAVAKQQARAEMQQQLDDDRAWTKAVQKYPTLEEDSDLEASVKGLRMQLLTTRGELLTYSQAADRILGKVSKQTAEARETGRKEARVSETIQERAGMTGPSSKAPAPTEEQELKKAMNSPNQKVAAAAREKYLSTYYRR